MITGSCLCGKVSYEVKKVKDQLIHCHCKFCQKNHSAAFSSNYIAEKADFKIVSGAESLSEYESSPGKIRSFCSNCGSSLWHTKVSQPETITIKAALIDRFDGFDRDKMDIFHINCESDKPWMSYEGYPKYQQARV